MIDFEERYIKYDSSITLEVFRKIWDMLYSNGWMHIYDHSIEAVYKDFSNGSPCLEPSSRFKKFQAYSTGSHSAGYTQILVSDFLRGTPSTPKEFKKDDVAIFCKHPSQSDWGTVNTIPVPFDEGEVVIIERTGKSSGGTDVVGIKHKSGSFPTVCFKQATEPDILKYARKKYPKGTEFSAVNSGDGRNNGAFDWKVKSEEYTWHPDSQVICCNGNMFSKGLWAPIKPGTKESLMEKAKRDYPEGTQIISAYSGNSFVLRGEEFHTNSDGDIISTKTSGGPVVYNNKKELWAQITKSVESKVSGPSSISLEELQKRFPIGTKFLPAHMTEDNATNYCIITTTEFLFESERIVSLTKEGKKYTGDRTEGSCTLDRVVWKNGKWANTIGIVSSASNLPFPLGTKVIIVAAVSGARGADGMIGTITDKPYTAGIAESTLKIDVGDNVWGVGDKATLKKFDDLSNSELIAQARIKYPIGTVFKSTITEKDNGIERIIKPYEGHSTIDWTIIERKGLGRCVYANNGLDDSKGGCSNPCIYSEVKGWAPIVNKSTSLSKFSIGDEVILRNERYKIAGKSYKVDAYILEYPKGWDHYIAEDWSEGTFTKGKHYYFIAEDKLTLAESKIPFKMGDAVRVIANNDDYGMDCIKVGDVGIIQSINSRGDEFGIKFHNRTSSWAAKANILSLVSTSHSVMGSMLSGEAMQSFIDVFGSPGVHFCGSPQLLGHSECLLEDEEGILPDLVFVSDSMELPVKKKAKVKIPKKEIVFI